eukprot:CAMPEP_0172763028 /NCGR_PEP_ID=MMETSP1074-20121228/174575_1 /TAXON_ID=2916 /ORGANISM="Ceratium fusus, Strain PA161109" /LENGTH=99 /DNA_ID=CAMNT_0013597527 /DNA_START=234 /DNA_END=533 /DNA_ORIENTATION=+
MSAELLVSASNRSEFQFRELAKMRTRYNTKNLDFGPRAFSIKRSFHHKAVALFTRRATHYRTILLVNSTLLKGTLDGANCLLGRSDYHWPTNAKVKPMA